MKNINCVVGKYIYFLFFVIKVVKDFNGIGFNWLVVNNVKYMIGVEIKNFVNLWKIDFFIKN